jgi:hypothetical protein
VVAFAGAAGAAVVGAGVEAVVVVALTGAVLDVPAAVGVLAAVDVAGDADGVPVVWAISVPIAAACAGAPDVTAAPGAEAWVDPLAGVPCAAGGVCPGDAGAWTWAASPA